MHSRIKSVVLVELLRVLLRRHHKHGAVALIAKALIAVALIAEAVGLLWIILLGARARGYEQCDCCYFKIYHFQIPFLVYVIRISDSWRINVLKPGQSIRVVIAGSGLRLPRWKLHI